MMVWGKSSDLRRSSVARLMAVVLLAQLLVAGPAHAANDMILSKRAAVWAEVIAKDAGFTHAFGLSSPDAVEACAACGPGLLAGLGVYEAGSALVFYLGVHNTGATYLSSNPARAQVTANGPDDWTISWEDDTDGDFGDLVVHVFVQSAPTGFMRGQRAHTWGKGGSTWGRNPTMMRSDPVNTATGNFVATAADLLLPVAGPDIFMERTYNSADTTIGTLGKGWTHSYGVELEVFGSLATLRAEDGQQVQFTHSAGIFTPKPGVLATLVKTADGYEATRRDNRRYRFNVDGRLVGIADANGNALTVAYDAGYRVTSVTDGAGRALILSYNADGLLQSASVPDGRIVAYGYTGGLLTSVTDAAGHTTNYTYDADGRLAQIIEPTGDVQISNLYDSGGRVSSQTDALGNVSTFTWDPATEVSVLTQADGGTWTDDYDNAVLKKTIDPDGGVTTFSTDPNLNIVGITDPVGTWTYTYDARGNVLSATDPVGASTTYEYDPANRPTKVTDPLGASTTYAYDANGNLQSATNAAGKVTTFDHDANGNPISVTDPAGRTTVFALDPYGNVTSVTNPAGATTTLEYDAAGRLVALVDPRGNESSASPSDYRWAYDYDDASRLTSLTDPLGNATAYAYDPSGRLSSVTSADGAVTTYTHNAAGEVLSATVPNGSVMSYAYDSTGNLVTATDPLGHVTTYTYDGRRNVTSVTDAAGKVTAYTYDGVGNRLTETSPLGHVRSFVYNARGDLLAQIDPRGHLPGATPAHFRWGYTYDAAGRLTSLSDPLGNVSRRTYSPTGRQLTATDPLGRVTTQAYNDADELVAVTDPAGAMTTFTYDAAGRIASQVDAAGHTSTTAYDAAGNVLSETDGAGNTASFGYDRAGRRISLVDPRGNVAGAAPGDFTWTYGYDAVGRVLRETDPLGNAWVREYDPAGRLIELTDPNGRATGYDLDAAGNVVQVKAPDGNATSYTYDALGRRTGRTDAKARTSSWTYDDSGRLIAEVSPAGRRRTYGYDADGNLVRITSAAGNATADAADGHTQYAYDAAGRLTGISYTDRTTYSFRQLRALADVRYAEPTPSVAFTYDAAGNRTSMTDGGGRETYTYDSRDRLKSVARGSLSVLKYDYDLRGLTSRRTYSDGSAVDYLYDAAGRLTRVTGPGGATNYAYDAADNPVAASLPNGQNEVRTYDPAARLTRIRTAKAAAVLDDLVYTLDASGAVVRLDAIGRTETYAYDVQGRVREVCYAASCAAPATPWIRYTYDEVGNRLTEQRPSATTSYAYDIDDQLVSAARTGLTASTVLYEHDPDGNVITEGDRHFAYDAAHRLTATVDGSTVRHFAYDGDGRRVQASTRVLGVEPVDVVRYTWDNTMPVPQVLMERDQANEVLRRYTFGLDRLSMTSDGGEHFFHQDRVGSTTHITSGTGDAEWAYTYEPFGRERSRSKLTPTAPKNVHQFAGEHLDPAIGLYQLRARHYHPGLGRFLQRDPLEQPAMLPYLSPYAYADGDPLNRTDPLGLRARPRPAYSVVYIAPDRFSIVVEPRLGLEAIGTFVPGAGDLADAALCGGSVVTGNWQDAKWDCPAMIPIGGAAARAGKHIDDAGNVGRRAPQARPAAPASRVSTGRTVPRNAVERDAMAAVQSNPADGKVLPFQMTDPRWHHSEGWVKMAKNVDGVEIHWVRNTRTGEVDDFKFKN